MAGASPPAKPGLLTQRLGAPGEHPATMYLRPRGAPPGSEPEEQVLEALGEEEADTAHPRSAGTLQDALLRLMLLEQHTAAETARLCGRPKTVEAQVFRAKMLAAQPGSRRKEGF